MNVHQQWEYARFQWDAGTRISFTLKQAIIDPRVELGGLALVPEVVIVGTFPLWH